jgi:hypothetical protein
MPLLLPNELVGWMPSLCLPGFKTRELVTGDGEAVRWGKRGARVNTISPGIWCSKRCFGETENVVIFCLAIFTIKTSPELEGDKWKRRIRSREALY